MLNYKPVRQIHRSSSGTVILEVKAVSDKRHYALKLIGPLAYPLNRLIFERENNALKALNGCAEVVHIYDVDKDFKYGEQHDMGGILLELIDGASLDEIRFEEYPETKKYAFCLQMARGMLCAHNNSIIHRDIKPSNIMLTQDECIKLIDFGSSKNKQLVERETTTNMYSPLYSAPEVLQSGIADEKSDIYSLGAVFF